MNGIFPVLAHRVTVVGCTPNILATCFVAKCRSGLRMGSLVTVVCLLALLVLALAVGGHAAIRLFLLVG